MLFCNQFVQFLDELDVAEQLLDAVLDQVLQEQIGRLRIVVDDQQRHEMRLRGAQCGDDVGDAIVQTLRLQIRIEIHSHLTMSKREE